MLKQTLQFFLPTLLLCSLSPAQDKTAEPVKSVEGLPLLLHEDFKDAQAALKRFTFSDPNAWKIDQDTVDGQKQNVLSQFQPSKSNPKVRSPFNQAWINDLKVGPFVM